MAAPDDLAEMAAKLELHPDYRILRRIVARQDFLEAGDQLTKMAVFLDVAN